MCAKHCIFSWILWKKRITGINYLGGIWTHDLAILEQMSYQLDHRDCPVARGSLNSIYSSGYHNSFCIGDTEYYFVLPYTDVCKHCILGTFPSPVKKTTGKLFGFLKSFYLWCDGQRAHVKQLGESSYFNAQPLADYDIKDTAPLNVWIKYEPFVFCVTSV